MNGLDFIVRPEWRFDSSLSDDDKKFLRKSGIAIDNNPSEGQKQKDSGSWDKR